MRVLTLLPLLFLVACSQEAEEAPAVPAESADPVVVYATYEDRDALPTFLAAFSEDTGIPVTVRHGEVETIVQDVLESRVTPYADVVLLPSVNDAWLLAEEGALRPIPGEYDSIPDSLKDPDGFWIAVSVNDPVVVSRKFADEQPYTQGVLELAEPQYNGRVCLSSSTLRTNQNLIAAMIQSLGQREAELTARGWVANSGGAIQPSENEMMDAMVAGRCDIGWSSIAAISRFMEANPESAQMLEIGAKSLTPFAFDIEAVGINRHAENTEGAAQLIDWMANAETLERFSEAMATGLPPTNYAQFPLQISASRLASLNEDAVKLAERARYR